MADPPDLAPGREDAEVHGILRESQVHTMMVFRQQRPVVGMDDFHEKFRILPERTGRTPRDPFAGRGHIEHPSVRVQPVFPITGEIRDDSGKIS
jgi:hypothetical protein